MPTHLGCLAKARMASKSSASSPAASWGCVPTVKKTSSYRSAIATTPAAFDTLVPIVIIRSTPAARARSTTPSRSSAKSGKSRWQWLSMIVIRRRPKSSLPRLRFDVAREDRRRRGQQRAGLEPMSGPNPPKRLVDLDVFGPHFEVVEIAFVWRHSEEIEQLVHRRGHDRLQHDRNDAQHFHRCVQN